MLSLLSCVSLSTPVCVCALYIICVCTSRLACRRPTTASHSRSLLIRTLLFHPIFLIALPHLSFFSKLLLFHCMISTSGRGAFKPFSPCIANLFYAGPPSPFVPPPHHSTPIPLPVHPLHIHHKCLTACTRAVNGPMPPPQVVYLPLPGFSYYIVCYRIIGAIKKSGFPLGSPELLHTSCDRVVFVSLK